MRRRSLNYRVVRGGIIGGIIGLGMGLLYSACAEIGGSERVTCRVGAHRTPIVVDYDARTVTHNGVTIPGAIVSQHLALAIYAVRTGGHDYRVFITREGGLVETLPDGPTMDGRCEPDRRIPVS